MLKPLARAVSTRRLIAGEFVIVVGLFLVYKYARLLIGPTDAVAFDNAARLMDVERLLGLPGELHVQHLLLSSDAAVSVANAFYAYVHFPVTGLFVVWLFVRSRQHYLQLRTVLILMTGASLAIHTAFPLAPPRLLDGLGFVDTAAAYGPSVYHAAPQTDSLANQFAAMPSLHFGWAVVVAIGVIRVSGSPRRWLWVLHPAITLFVIVGTANHYWLDAVVAGALLVVADHAVRRWRPAGRLARPVAFPRVRLPPPRVRLPPREPRVSAPISSIQGPKRAAHGGVSRGGGPSRAASRSPRPRNSSRAPAP